MLTCLIQVAPLFQQIFPIDNMIGITDREKYLALIPGKIVRPPFDVVGTPIPPGDPLKLAIQRGEISSTTMPKEVFGFAFKSIAIPIKDDDGRIIGALGLAISTDNQDILNDAAHAFSETSEEITTTTEDLTLNALALAKQLTEVKELSEVVQEQIMKTDTILKFINDIAKNSKLLGLNAAIEASRAGEHGRGFGVVADEIGKMAINSASSVKDIKEILTLIRDKSDEMINQINLSTELAEKQATASEGIAEAMNELSSSAENIRKVAQII